MHTVNLPCCICWASSVPTLPQFDANALAKSSGQLPLQKLPTIPPCALTKKAPLVMITYNNLNIHVQELTKADTNAAVQSLAKSRGKLQLVGMVGMVGIFCAWADAASMQTREKAAAGSTFILALQNEGHVIDIIEIINIFFAHYYNHAHCNYKPLGTIEPLLSLELTALEMISQKLLLSFKCARCQKSRPSG